MFIGKYEIDSEKEIDNGYIQVSFKEYQPVQGDPIVPQNEVFSKEVLKAVKTKEQQDFNFVRDGRCDIVLKEILTSLLSHNIKISEISYLISRLQENLQNSVDEADKKLWGNDGFNRTLLQVNTIIN